MWNKPKSYLAAILARLGGWIPDDIYLKWRFKLLMGQTLHLDNPQTFNEKLNWLKINNRQPWYPNIADKSKVKEFVEKIIGTEYIIPTIGVWDNWNDIDFDILPQQFVLKSTNGGGGTGVIICRDKEHFNWQDARKKLEKSMATNWDYGREWVYRDIKPRIIAEQYMKNEGANYLDDYKFMCFNGEPKLLFMASDRYAKGESLKFDWYDMELNHLPIKSRGYKNKNRKLTLTPQFEKMKQIARELSKNFPHIRVDLYLINGKIYFGELTFFHDAGLVAIEPIEWDYKIGSWLSLPQKTLS